MSWWIHKCESANNEDFSSLAVKTSVCHRWELNFGSDPCFSARLVTGGSSVALSFWVFFSLESVLLPEPALCTMVSAFRGAELAVFFCHQKRSQCGPAEHAGRETSWYEHIHFLRNLTIEIHKISWLAPFPLFPLYFVQGRRVLKSIGFSSSSLL